MNSQECEWAEGSTFFQKCARRQFVRFKTRGGSNKGTRTQFLALDHATREKFIAELTEELPSVSNFASWLQRLPKEKPCPVLTRSRHSQQTNTEERQSKPEQVQQRRASRKQDKSKPEQVQQPQIIPRPKKSKPKEVETKTSDSKQKDPEAQVRLHEVYVCHAKGGDEDETIGQCANSKCTCSFRPTYDPQKDYIDSWYQFVTFSCVPFVCSDVHRCNECFDWWCKSCANIPESFDPIDLDFVCSKCLSELYMKSHEIQSVNNQFISLREHVTKKVANASSGTNKRIGTLRNRMDAFANQEEEIKLLRERVESLEQTLNDSIKDLQLTINNQMAEMQKQIASLSLPPPINPALARQPLIRHRPTSAMTASTTNPISGRTRSKRRQNARESTKSDDDSPPTKRRRTSSSKTTSTRKKKSLTRADKKGNTKKSVTPAKKTKGPLTHIVFRSQCFFFVEVVDV